MKLSLINPFGLFVDKTCHSLDNNSVINDCKVMGVNSLISLFLLFGAICE